MKSSWMAWIIFLLFTVPSFGGEPQDYIQFVDSGCINWTTGVLQSQGVGMPPKDNFTNDTKPRTQKEAMENAREKLLKVIYQVRVDAMTLVGEIARANEELNERLKAMVEKAEVVKQVYLSDGTLEVTLEISLYGGFAQMILPNEIIQLSFIKPVNEKKSEKETKPVSEDAVQKEVEKKYTGLVVNACGLKALPSMAPKILDEVGEQVYGAAFVSREFAVQEGMCGYSKELSSALSDGRVAGNPLTVKGLRTNESALTDIVISDADASRIRSSSENLSFLRKCRVMIVLD